jgi:hypothetical protein
MLWVWNVLLKGMTGKGCYAVQIICGYGSQRSIISHIFSVLDDDELVVLKTLPIALPIAVN